MIVLPGSVFERLTVVKPAITGNIRRGKAWLCRCACGAEKVVHESHLVSGGTKSCGCKRRERLHPAVTLNKMPEYYAWRGIWRRCEGRDKKAAKYYSDRGIRVCDRWASFDNFMADMGRMPAPQYSIERKDVNKSYEPSNCTWIPKRHQAKNTRRSILVGGLCLRNFCRYNGLKYHKVRDYRLRLNLPLETALGMAQP